MGLIEKGLLKYVPNATQCLTWGAVQESHNAKRHKIVFALDNIFGMLILLAIGLGAALLVSMTEYIRFKTCGEKEDLNTAIVI